MRLTAMWVLAWGLVLRPTVAAAQQPPAVLHGRVVDSTGAGAQAAVTVRPATAPDSVLAQGRSAADGIVRIPLRMLPATVRVEAQAANGLRAELALDSAVVRASATRPIMLRLGAPQEIAAVEVRAQYQRRPAVRNFFVLDETTRTDVTGTTTPFYDPLAFGGLETPLAASPDLLIGTDGQASAFGLPADANQLQMDGVQMPAGLGTGILGGTLTLSPWDATIGGAAGATLRLYLRPASRYRNSYAILRTGASGVPSWAEDPEAGSGLTVPVHALLGTAGPVGHYAYRVYGFTGWERTPRRRWTGLVSSPGRAVLDSVSAVLAGPTLLAEDEQVQFGLLGRIDFVPDDPKRVIALSLGGSRTLNDAGLSSGFATGTVASEARETTAFAIIEASRVLRERVLWTSILSGTASDHSMDPRRLAPQLLVRDPLLGYSVIAGGAPPQPETGRLTAQARSTWSWYSLDNKIRYTGQLEGQVERGRREAVPAHTTFTVASLADLGSGSALALTRTGSTGASHALSWVVAPSMTARIETGRRQSVLLGLRSDIWHAQDLAGADRVSAVDLSPRVAYHRQMGTRVQGGPVATLRVGAGRFTSWPNVQFWSDAWAGGGQLIERCAGAIVPPIDLAVPAARCGSTGTVQAIAGVEASGGLKPVASDRAEVSLSFTEVVPGVRGEVGVALARATRVNGRLSPLAYARVIETLGGEAGRALLVEADSINATGVVPVAALGSSAQSAALVADGRSHAVQYRVKVASRDPFARITAQATYVLTTGRERGLGVANPFGPPGYLEGPLSAGGRHTIAVALSSWLGLAQLQLSSVLRSGVRFTPLADRDLNGDGRANDAVFVPTNEAGVWAAQVAPRMRDCVKTASGRIAGINSCTGPWSVWSLLTLVVPASELGLPHGSTVDLQLSNPFGLFASNGAHPGVVYGPPAAVDPTLAQVIGFDHGAGRFTAVPQGRFGTPVGVASGVSAPVRVAIGVRLPLGPSIVRQKAAVAAEALEADTSARGHTRTAMQFLADLPPLPAIVMQGAQAAGLTAEQRQRLGQLMGRWQSAATQVVRAAAGSTSESAGGTTQRLVAGRATFMEEVHAIAAEIRALLTPDQVELLSGNVRQLLNPRFLRFIAAMDAGEI